VEYEDRISIATPEGVDLELALAGVGSRFVAAIVDLTLQTLLVIALALVFVIGGVGLGGADAAVFTLAAFALFASYDILFEVFASGRTPGKRFNGLRVVRDDGSPVGFLTSTVRNVLRLIDILPGGYLVGIVAILATSRNQRLGDIAAGTLVVRERRAANVLAPHEPTDVGIAWETWDVSAIAHDEVAAVRLFLDRRGDLAPGPRADRARELAAALRPKVVGVPEWIGNENFLEQLAAAKGRRSL
jgi:uncharacterized RDD family membrane protein YckC